MKGKVSLVEIKLHIIEWAKTILRTAIWADVTATYRILVEQMYVRCEKDLQGAYDPAVSAAVTATFRSAVNTQFAKRQWQHKRSILNAPEMPKTF